MALENGFSSSVSESSVGRRGRTASLQQTHQLILPSKSQNGNNLLDPRDRHLEIGDHTQEEHNAWQE